MELVMDRLSILLTTMVGAVIAGVIVVAAFVMGYYSVYVLVVAAGVSLILSWPLSCLISRQIKRNDPNWHKNPTPKAVPDPSAPEV